LTTAALLSTGALAQNPGETAKTPFDMLDADHSGSINAQEAQAHATVSENFAVADKDGDGAITREEFDATFTSAPRQQPPDATPPGLPPEPEPES
jgi:Ca2+-binding EF-hand superfamily protein